MKMKYFQLAQKYLAFLGISSTQEPINQRILVTSMLYAVTWVSMCAFLIREAISFKEYIDAIFMITATITLYIQFAIIAFQPKKIFTIIEAMENIDESSESAVKFQFNKNVTHRVYITSNSEGEN